MLSAAYWYKQAWYSSWSSLSLAVERKEVWGDKEREYMKSVMKGVTMEKGEGHGKGLLLRGVQALSVSCVK